MVLFEYLVLYKVLTCFFFWATPLESCRKCCSGRLSVDFCLMLDKPFSSSINQQLLRMEKSFENLKMKNQNWAFFLFFKELHINLTKSSFLAAISSYSKVLLQWNTIEATYTLNVTLVTENRSSGVCPSPGRRSTNVRKYGTISCTSYIYISRRHIS